MKNLLVGGSSLWKCIIFTIDNDFPKNNLESMNRILDSVLTNISACFVNNSHSSLGLLDTDAYQRYIVYIMLGKTIFCKIAKKPDLYKNFTCFGYELSLSGSSENFAR